MKYLGECYLVMILCALLSGCSSAQKKPESNYLKGLSTTSELAVDGKLCKTFRNSAVDWRKLIASANSCIRQRDTKNLESIIDNFFVHHPDSPWGLFYKSELAIINGNYEIALWINNKGSKTFENTVLWNYQKAKIKYLTANFSDTVSILRQVLSKDRQNAEVFVLLGHVYQKFALHDKALENFKIALEISPNHPVALKEMIRLRRIETKVTSKQGED